MFKIMFMIEMTAKVWPKLGSKVTIENSEADLSLNASLWYLFVLFYPQTKDIKLTLMED